MFRQYNVYPSVCFHYVANVYLIKMQLPFMIWGNFISSYTQIDKIDYNRVMLNDSIIKIQISNKYKKNHTNH